MKNRISNIELNRNWEEIPTSPPSSFFSTVCGFVYPFRVSQGATKNGGNGAFSKISRGKNIKSPVIDR